MAPAIDFKLFGEPEALCGFTPYSIKELLNGKTRALPKERGIYIVFSPRGFKPSYLPMEKSIYYRGKAAFLEEPAIKEKWVEGTRVLYIGKAGGLKQSTGLRARLNAYIAFGQRKQNASHWGGRHIWQLKNIEECGIAVLVTADDQEPAELETALLARFKKEFGRLPFANRKG